MSIEAADLNTILAALRYYQSAGMGNPANRPDDIHALATNYGEDISRDDAGIDTLCEALYLEWALLTTLAENLAMVTLPGEQFADGRIADDSDSCAIAQCVRTARTITGTSPDVV